MTRRCYSCKSVSESAGRVDNAVDSECKRCGVYICYVCKLMNNSLCKDCIAQDNRELRRKQLQAQEDEYSED